jgi:hypothetical protein
VHVVCELLAVLGSESACVSVDPPLFASVRLTPVAVVTVPGHDPSERLFALVAALPLTSTQSPAEPVLFLNRLFWIFVVVAPCRTAPAPQLPINVLLEMLRAVPLKLTAPAPPRLVELPLNVLFAIFRFPGSL